MRAIMHVMGALCTDKHTGTAVLEIMRRKQTLRDCCGLIMELTEYRIQV